MRMARGLFGMLVAAAVTQFAAAQVNIGPQIRVDTNGGTDAANETSSASTALFPNEIVKTWNDWRASTSSEIIRMGVALSMDGGATWNDFLVRPPAPNQSSVEGDPMTAFDPRTGTLWVGAISFASNGGLFVARKDPGNASFESSVMARTTGGADKCWMAAGPQPGDPDSTRLYITYNQGVISSDDMGDTWTNPVPIAGGIGFLPRVGPGGELYVAYWDFGSGMKLARSLDGGASFTIHHIATRMDVWGTQDGSRFPGTFRCPSLVYIAVDPNDGTLYACYFDTTDVQSNGSNVDLYFCRSFNQGTTWTTPTVINTDPALAGDQFFPWMEVDEDGRIHLVCFNSKNTSQDDNTTFGFFDAYYMFSGDDGLSWSEHRLTPTAWNSNNDGLDRPSQFIGDYLGLALAGEVAWPTYLDTSNGDTDVYTNKIEIFPLGDINMDGVVDTADMLLMLADWGFCGPGACPADLNGDFSVNTADLLILLANWS